MIIPKAVEITQHCFDWCKEQSFIHQSNLEISELTFIVIALISIVVHRTVIEHWDYFIGQGFDAEFLDKIHDASTLLAFVMLILFVIYMMWLR